MLRKIIQSVFPQKSQPVSQASNMNHQHHNQYPNPYFNGYDSCHSPTGFGGIHHDYEKERDVQAHIEYLRQLEVNSRQHLQNQYLSHQTTQMFEREREISQQIGIANGVNPEFYQKLNEAYRQGIENARKGG